MSGRVHLGGQKHFYLEPNSVVVSQTGEKDELVVHLGTQNPDIAQSNVAHVLGLPKSRVVVKMKRVGGAFGGKERMLHALIAAVAARKTNRQVRLVYTRYVVLT